MRTLKTKGVLVFMTVLVSLPAQADLLGFEDSVEEKNFAKLLRHYPQGMSERTPWAGFWWDYKSDGIAKVISYGQPSPSEKYDLLMGLQGRRASTPWEKENHGRSVPGVKDWWGHCNGWTAAALLAPEPRRQVRIENVTFGVGDQKALISEVYMEVAADFLGSRHNARAMRGHASYDDPTPGQFHLAVVNLLGRQGQAFALDRHTGNEVWNHPVVGYRIDRVRPEDYLGEDPQAPGIYRVRVSLTFWMVEDGVEPDFVTPEFRFQQDSKIFPSRTIQYELWLDGPIVFSRSGAIQSSGDIVLLEDPQTGEILSGRWLNDHRPRNERHPDFLWIPFESTPSSGYRNPRVDAETVERIIRGISPWEARLAPDWWEKGFE